MIVEKCPGFHPVFGNFVSIKPTASLPRKNRRAKSFECWWAMMDQNRHDFPPCARKTCRPQHVFVSVVASKISDGRPEQNTTKIDRRICPEIAGVTTDINSCPLRESRLWSAMWASVCAFYHSRYEANHSLREGSVADLNVTRAMPLGPSINRKRLLFRCESFCQQT